jgi:hypothetical protein
LHAAEAERQNVLTAERKRRARRDKKAEVRETALKFALGLLERSISLLQLAIDSPAFCIP